MRKWTKTLAASAAALAAALLASLIVLSCVPSRTAGRYVDGEDFSGEVMTDATVDASHGGHSENDGWVDLNATKSDDAVCPDGLSWDEGLTTCTINPEGGAEAEEDDEYHYSYRLYLSDDLEADIVIAGLTEYPYANDYNVDVAGYIVVDLCLAGHALIGTGEGSVITVGAQSTCQNEDYPDCNGAATVNLLDCGGSREDGVYDNVHYYKRGTAHTLWEGTVVYEGYDFSSEDSDGNVVGKDNSDGYVRGGLITGGDAKDNYHGGGVTVGYGSVLNMYGGTIAGNGGTYGGGVLVYDASERNYNLYGSGGNLYYVPVDFNMYGGTIAGNRAGSYGGGVAVIGGVNLSYARSSATFRLYGGEIKDNYAGSYGGGVLVGRSGSSSGKRYFYMYAGTIEGNYGSSGGGVCEYGNTASSVYVYFYMYGGVVRNNIAQTGGGIEITSYVNGCTIRDAEITGNRAIGTSETSVPSGGGVYYHGPGTTTASLTPSPTIGGATVVYGNYAMGKICNVQSSRYTSSGTSYYIYITMNSLSEGARIGVTPATDQTQITKTSSSSSDWLKYFYSDDTAYEVCVYGSGSSSYIGFAARA